MKQKKKRSSLEYSPVTEQELRDLSDHKARLAMELELLNLSGGFPHYPQGAAESDTRYAYIAAEAYERWADELQYTEYMEKIFSVSHSHKRTKKEYKGILGWLATGSFVKADPYSRVDKPKPNKLNAVA